MVKLNSAEEERLAELLLQWEEAWDSGQELTASELCSDAPELAEHLDQQISILKRMAWMKEDASLSEHADAQDSLIGSIFGNRYEIKSLLSYGGFGVVYAGYDRELERDVAVKILRRDKKAVKQANLLEEAKRTAKLRHPGIVPVFDVGRQDELVFVVTEYVAGRTLADAIEHDRPTIIQSAGIIAEIADALKFAHQNNFVHNDIKPSNILIDQTGRPILSDFGSATTLGQAVNESDEASGTLPYMAPEKLRDPSNNGDTRSDIYSLGVVFYQLLTGRLPFETASPLRLREQVINQSPLQPRSQDPAIPKQLEVICLKCLSKDPSERYQTASELKHDLTVFGTAKAKRKSFTLLVFMSILVLSVTALWFVTTSDWLSSDQIAVGQVFIIKEEGTHSNAIAFSPNGKMLVSGGMDSIVHVWDVTNGSKENSLVGHENWILSLTFSSDGEYVFTGSGGFGINESMSIGNDHTIREWSVSNGKEVRKYIGHKKPVRGVAINRDNDTIASASADGTVRLWDRQTGGEKLQIALKEGFPTSVVFSSLKRFVLVGTNKGKILVWDVLDNKIARSIAAHEGHIHLVAVSPNQRTFLSASSDGTAKLWSDRSKSLRFACPHSDAVLSIAFSPDSTRFLTGSDDGLVRLWDTATGKELHRFYGHLGNVWSVAISPDGKLAASAGNDMTIRFWRLPQ
jgi:serine/threonine-protein kinase